MAGMTERVSIGVDAVQLGWSIAQESDRSAFGYDGRTLTVWWSDNGDATAAELRTTAGEDGLPGTDIIAHREWFGEHGTVGDWVRDALRTWQFRYQSEVGA